MKETLSPKELAIAIGVSESSLRRWVDSGALAMSRTEGGHRRIPVAEAVRFIRSSGATVARPGLLGLPAYPAKRANADATDRLYQALLGGDALLAKGLIVFDYLAGQSLPSILDGPVAHAMHRVGELFHHDARGILVEHRATAILIHTLSLLHQLLPAPPKSAPVAIGGAPSGDVYAVPSLLVSAVLTDAGYRVTNFGPDTPLETLALAAAELRPTLAFLSLTSSAAAAKVSIAAVRTLADRLADVGTLLVVGGRQSTPFQRIGHPNVHILGSVTELSAFAKGACRR